jgi:hypothetical protein
VGNASGEFSTSCENGRMICPTAISHGADF